MVTRTKTNMSSVYKEVGKNRRITDKVKDLLVEQCKSLEKEFCKKKKQKKF